MKKMRIIGYTAERKPEWNALVDGSRNGTFLLRRDYMDYHADRFDDCSLMLVSERDELLAVMPANRCGTTLYSHQGLTYGGWIMSEKHTDMLVMLEAWNLMSDFCKDSGIGRIVYKPVPHIYHRYPAEEDLYALWRAGGLLKSRLVSTAIDLHNPIPFNQNARRKLGRVDGLTIAESNRYADFWPVLEALLDSRYGVSPVHSLAEMTLLHQLMPDNIRLVTAELGGRVLAGAVFYMTDTVVHLQYCASSDEGKQLNVFPDLYRYVIERMCGNRRYLDFGTSNEDAGRYLNEGLVRQKCGMGGRAIVYDTYEVTIS